MTWLNEFIAGLSPLQFAGLVVVSLGLILAAIEIAAEAIEYHARKHR